MARTAAKIIQEIETDLSEMGESGPTPTSLLRYFNEGMRNLARESRCFLRTEILVPDGSRVYTPASTPERIRRVRYNKKRIPFRSEDWLDVHRENWMTEAGEPEYWTGEREVTATPLKASGTSLSFTGSPAITEAAGYQITGADYWVADSSGTKVFFKPGDGEVTNETAASNLWVEYSFLPTDCDAATSIPDRYERALVSYTFWRALKDGADFQRAYEQERDALLIVEPTHEYRHYDAMQKAAAQGEALPKNYEDAVHSAWEDGDPTGKDLDAGREFLVRAYQAAIAEGKAVPPEVLRALEKFEHSTGTAYEDEIRTALTWKFLERYVSDAMARGLPIPPTIMAAYLNREEELRDVTEERSLATEVVWSSHAYLR